jgi:hypothetical protein
MDLREAEVVVRAKGKLIGRRRGRGLPPQALAVELGEVIEQVSEWIGDHCFT